MFADFREAGSDDANALDAFFATFLGYAMDKLGGHSDDSGIDDIGYVLN